LGWMLRGDMSRDLAKVSSGLFGGDATNGVLEGFALIGGENVYRTRGGEEEEVEPSQTQIEVTW
jgi:hypothetical protein